MVQYTFYLYTINSFLCRYIGAGIFYKFFVGASKKNHFLFQKDWSNMQKQELKGRC